MLSHSNRKVTVDFSASAQKKGWSFHDPSEIIQSRISPTLHQSEFQLVSFRFRQGQFEPRFRQLLRRH
jgi:hypothetical protein